MAYTFSQGYMRGNGNPNLDLQIQAGGNRLPKIYIDDLTDFMYKFDASKPVGERWVVLKDDPRPYKVYTALLSQGGTAAPTAVVLENTLGDINFGYDSAGIYEIHSNGLFIAGKTAIIMGNERSDIVNNVILTGIYRENDSTYYLFTNQSSFGESSNNVLKNTLIEIRVYD
jgi:hypothetical protein